MNDMKNLLDRMAAARGGDDQEGTEQAPVEQEQMPEPVEYAPSEDELYVGGQDPDAPAIEGDESLSSEQEHEPVSLSSLSDIAEALGVPVESLYDVSIPVSMDGSRVDVRLGEWKDSYKDSRALERARQKLADQEREIAQNANKWAERVSGAEAMLGAMNQAIEAEEKSIDWRSLREEDPQEYILKKQEFQERKAAIREQSDLIKKQQADSYNEYQRQMRQRQEEFLENERNALLRALPEWRDPEKAKSGKAELSAYLSGIGFSSEEINQIADHRVILVARDAMKYRAARKRAAENKKPAKKATPTLKPSARAPRGTAKQEEVDRLRARLKKTGRIQDAMNVMRATRQK